MKYINKIIQNKKSVQSIHPCMPKDGVIHMSDDIAKANGSELNTDAMEGEECSITILLNDIL